MWLLVVIIFVSMTLADTFGSSYTILINAPERDFLQKIPYISFTSHDAAYLLDGCGDLAAAFSSVGAGLSFLGVHIHKNFVHIQLYVNWWSALAAVAIVLGSYLGGLLGDTLSKRITGVKLADLPHHPN